MYLKQCGTQVIIKTNLGLTRVADIVDIQKDENSSEIIRDLMNARADTDMLPISVSDERFLINYKGTVVEKQLLKHVINGYCIETSQKYHHPEYIR